MVRVKNPDTGMKADVEPAELDSWLKTGWIEIEENKPEVKDMAQLELGKKTATKDESEKKAPTMSGSVELVTEAEDGVKRYESVGRIAFWPNEKKTGKQPDFYGRLQPPKDQPGPTYSVSLWDRSKGASK